MRALLALAIAAALPLVAGVVVLLAFAGSGSGDQAEPIDLGLVTGDEPFLAVAERVPGFGGMYLDEDGRLTVHLLDTSRGAAVEEAIIAVFGRDTVPPGGVRVLQGKYSFPQLAEWYARLGNLFDDVRGVTLADIDDASNRLTVGIEGPAWRERVVVALRRLGVPLEAVRIEETGAIRPLGAR